MASYTVQVKKPHSAQYEEFIGCKGLSVEAGGVLLIQHEDGGHSGINSDYWEEFIVEEEENE